jgi:FtsZ-binding cell division protein ZapB
VSDSNQVDEQENILESKITKAVDKLKYYLEETDELIENNEISELRIASKRTDEIRDELNDLISRVQELKLDSETQRKGRSGYGKRI